MASATEPGREELQEIGRRLCALAGIVPEEPACAATLRQALHDPACCENKSVVLALGVCADALAAHELPPKVLRLREAVDAYADWSERGRELRAQVVSAIIEAQPILDENADTRAEACRAIDITDEQRAQGFVPAVWPSPASLREFPQEVLDLIRREAYAVRSLQKVMHDLSRLDADRRIFARLSPIKIGITKTLAAGRYSIAAITNVLEPLAKRGPERTQARNTIRRRLESRSKDLHYVQPDGSGEMVAAENEQSARSLAGVGPIVRVEFGDRPQNAGNPDE